MGKTSGGITIDDSWKENDGLVNTVSAAAPAGAPSKAFDSTDICSGIWNIFPTVEGDHMWLQGGLTRKHDIRGFYVKLLDMIDNLQQKTFLSQND